MSKEEYNLNTQEHLIRWYTNPKKRERLREHIENALLAPAERNLLPRTIDALRSKLRRPTPENTVAFLNRIFEADIPAHYVLPEVRNLPNPIVVDFNGVLASTTTPLQPNPEASKFVSLLREIGSVFVVTHSSDWNSIQSFLQENGVWTKDMVLMAARSFEFIEGWGPDYDTEVGRKICAEYLKMRERVILADHTMEWIVGPKKIAPLFCKLSPVPIIDDTAQITRDNYGMLGLLVRRFEPTSKRGQNEERYSLGAAVSVVRNHYSIDNGIL